MFLVLAAIVAGGMYLFPALASDPLAGENWWGNMFFELATNVIFTIFLGGLYYLAVRKVVGDDVSWKMTFKGFSVAWKIFVVAILQTILITIGLFLLILPGIYLIIGYMMTLPLIVDKGLSPWQAMETSRKAIHRVWWKIAGLSLIVGFIITISAIPLGLGLIWSWPLAIIMVGVVYCKLFGAEKIG